MREAATPPSAFAMRLDKSFLALFVKERRLPTADEVDTVAVNTAAPRTARGKTRKAA